MRAGLVGALGVSLVAGGCAAPAPRPVAPAVAASPGSATAAPSGSAAAPAPGAPTPRARPYYGKDPLVVAALSLTTGKLLVLAGHAGDVPRLLRAAEAEARARGVGPGAPEEVTAA